MSRLSVRSDLANAKTPGPQGHIRHTGLDRVAGGSYGTRLQASRAIDHHDYERVCNFLLHRHKMQNRSTYRFPAELVFRELGALHLISVYLGPRCVP